MLTSLNVVYNNVPFVKSPVNNNRDRFVFNAIIKRFLLSSLLTIMSFWVFPISTLGHITNRNAALPPDQQGLPAGTVAGSTR